MIDWIRYANCAGTDPDAWFPRGNANVSMLRAICRDCLVRPQCLQAALDNEDIRGYWAGHTETERKRLRAGRLVG